MRAAEVAGGAALVGAGLLGRDVGKNALDTHRTVILILPAVRELFAMSTAALSNAQSSAQKLVNDYRDALILDHEGNVCRVERIDVLGAAGTSAIQRMISALATKSKRIAVTLSEPLPIALSELNSMLIACITNGGYCLDPDADGAERHRMVTSVESAPGTIALFRTFKLPAPDEALDVL